MRINEIARPVVEPLGLTVDELQDQFMEGRCYPLAVAHHRRYGWPIYVLGGYEDETVRNYRTIHCFHALVKHPTGPFIDIRGPESSEALLAEWDDCELLPLTEAQLFAILNPRLRQLVKADLDFASKAIDHYLGRKYPHLYTVTP